jgi:plasmid segregation protein ParM
MHTPFIGIDIGRSAVKAIARQGARTFSVTFPSAVCAAQEVVFEEIAAKAAVDAVDLRGETFWTGETALTQHWGGEAIGRNDDWVMGPQHDVLIAAAMKRLQAAGLQYDGTGVVNLGVPSRVFRGRRDLVLGLKKNAEAVLDRGVPGLEVYVHAQPMGVVASHTLDADGYMREGASLEDGSFAVIEIGQFTTDFTAVLKGEPIIQATASCEGVELIMNHMRGRLRDQGIQLPHVDLHQLLADRSIRVRGARVDLGEMLDEGISKVFLPKVIENAKKTLSPALLQSVDQILVAGGGAAIAMPGLEKNAMFSHAIVVNEPRLAVADGLARLSAMVHALSQQQEA